MKLVNGICCRRYSRIESKRDNSPTQIVINGFRDTDDRDTLCNEFLGDPERAVSPDAYQHIQANIVKIFNNFVRYVPDFNTGVSLNRILKRVSAVRSAQN